MSKGGFKNYRLITNLPMKVSVEDLDKNLIIEKADNVILFSRQAF